MRGIVSAAMVLFMTLLLPGCVTGPRPVLPPVAVTPVLVELEYSPIVAPAPDAVSAQAPHLPAGLPPLNVSLRTFTSPGPANNAPFNPARQIKSAETRYLPYVLKQTLERSGYWGAVSLLPRRDPSAELDIIGSLDVSDGVELKLRLKAVDATGRVWLDQAYYEVATDLSYATDPDYLEDPFQSLFNQMANDLSKVLKQLTPREHTRILKTTLLQYAAALSPESFADYLSTDRAGRVSLVGLPVEDDPALIKVEKIRESEYLFADVMDAHYESLFHQIGPTYAWWRHYSYELIAGNEKLEKIDATRGATRGSWYAMERIYKTFKESRMNEDALRELTASFDNETRPILAKVAGRVIELDGTLDVQYEEWRRILREVYREETGF